MRERADGHDELRLLRELEDDNERRDAAMQERAWRRIEARLGQGGPTGGGAVGNAGRSFTRVKAAVAVVAILGAASVARSMIETPPPHEASPSRVPLLVQQAASELPETAPSEVVASPRVTTASSGQGAAAGEARFSGESSGTASINVVALPAARATTLDTPKKEVVARPVAKSRPADSDALDADLAAERAAIEAIRENLRKADSSAALTAIEAHRVRFARGRLVDERESLRVQALALAGRDDQAREAGARFRARYPGSLFLPVVDEVVRSLP